MSKKQVSFTDAVVAAITLAADMLGKEPNEVTKVDLLSNGLISDYTLRMAGSLPAIKKASFPVEGKDLAGMHKNRKASGYISRLEKQVGEVQSTEELMRDVIKNLKPVKVKGLKQKFKSGKKERHLVGMLNDTHYGVIVDPEEVNGTNKYGWQEASRRTAFFINQMCSYKIDKRKEVKSAHLILNGDLIAGVIHGLTGRDIELLVHQTNGLLHILTHAVTRLGKNFSEVNIYLTNGNHSDLPHRREGGRVLSQVYDNFEHMVFYALSAVFKQNKHIKFHTTKSKILDINLPAGRVGVVHGHTLFSKALGNPGTTVNSKQLGQAIMEYNNGELAKGRESYKLLLFAHTHCHFYITTKDGVQVYNAPSLSGVDSYADSLTINHNFIGQLMFESTPDYLFGDNRLVRLNAADKDKNLDKIIPPYKHELIWKKNE